MERGSSIEAMIFAMEAHKDHFRKYTGDHYSNHLAEVAGIAATRAHQYPIYQEEMISCAWLHDSVEDVGVTIQEIQDKFGYTVAEGVAQLSDLEKGNREERNRLSRLRLSKAFNFIQTVKVADMISNTKSIVKFDPKFAKTYLVEKEKVIDVLIHADRHLIDFARDQIWNCKVQLEEAELEAYFKQRTTS